MVLMKRVKQMFQPHYHIWTQQKEARPGAVGPFGIMPNAAQ